MRLEGTISCCDGICDRNRKSDCGSICQRRCAGCDRHVNLQGAEAVAHEIQSRKEAALPVQMDVSSEKSVESAFGRVIKEFGSIDILLSNAGIQIIHPIVDFPFADWQQVIAIHLHGAFLTTRAAMRSMIASGRGGCILYMGSVHSFIAALNKSAYVAAKHALGGLTRSVAKEGAKHQIRANMISPGFVRTALVEKQIPEQAQQLGITEEEVVKNVMLGATVDGEFTSVLDLA